MLHVACFFTAQTGSSCFVALGGHRSRHETPVPQASSRFRRSGLPFHSNRRVSITGRGSREGQGGGGSSGFGSPPGHILHTAGLSLRPLKGRPVRPPIPPEAPLSPTRRGGGRGGWKSGGPTVSQQRWSGSSTFVWSFSYGGLSP